MLRFHLLGPIYLGEGSHAFLGLEISADNQVEPVVVVWLPGEPQDTSLEQVKQEAQSATLLKHPNILKLHGLYELDGRMARVVDYVDGEPLQRFLDVEKSLAVPLVARIICDAAEGIHYAHNVAKPPRIHGALRPETLMLSFSGLVRVSGYGAQVFASKKPTDPRFRGRRKHIAPEQIIGGDGAASPQTDIYLLGLCLYECITGMLPFIAETNFDEAVLTRPLPPMPPETPSALESVIARACAKKASDRYESVLEFRQAVLSAVGVLPSHEELSQALNTWIPPEEKSRSHRKQLMDEGLNQLLSTHPFKPKTSPADLAPPPVSSAYLPGQPPAEPAEPQPEFPLENLTLPPTPLRPRPENFPPPVPFSPDAVTLPPFKMEPPSPKTPKAPHAPKAAAVPVFSPPRKMPPRPSYDDDDEFDSKSSSSALSWAVGGFIAACAVAVIVYFTVLAEPAPARVAEPVKPPAPPPVAVPPPAPAPEPAQTAEAPPPPAKPPQKTKTAARSGAASKSAAKPKPDANPALVNVLSDMPLDISFKGKRVGKTPAKLSLPPGKVTLLFSNKNAGVRTRRQLELKAGQSLDLNVQLEKATLNINAPAGAQIFVNGSLRGTAPMGNIELWEGEHRLSVNYQGHVLSESFSLAPGGYMNYDVTQTQN